MKEAEPSNNKGTPVYREDLPDDCPPVEAIEIVEVATVFRLVKNNPASNDDFRSHRALKPNRSFPGIAECQARGLSVHTDRSDTVKLLKLPSLKGCFVCKVTLDVGAGKIEQTNKPSHHTWWPFAGYDILANCVIEI